MRRFSFLILFGFLLIGCSKTKPAVYTVSSNYEGILFIKYTDQHSGISTTKKILPGFTIKLLELSTDEYKLPLPVTQNIHIEQVSIATGQNIPIDANDPSFWIITPDNNRDNYHLMIDTTYF